MRPTGAISPALGSAPAARSTGVRGGGNLCMAPPRKPMQQLAWIRNFTGPGPLAIRI